MARIWKPPAAIERSSRRSVFLAGSIEMGRADDWQSLVEKSLADLDIEIFNPRREDWDSSWKQSITDIRFREQVEWELSALESANVIAMYFAPQTQAPITLLELGLFARAGKVLVACPEGYWRKGNIEIVLRDFPFLLLNRWKNSSR